VAVKKQVDNVVSKQAANVMMVGAAIERMMDESDSEPIEWVFAIAKVRLNLLLGQKDAYLVGVITAEPCGIQSDDMDGDVNMRQAARLNGVPIAKEFPVGRA